LSAGAAIDEAAKRLAAAGINEARREARLLLAEATGWEADSIVAHPERELDEHQASRLA